MSKLKVCIRSNANFEDRYEKAAVYIMLSEVSVDKAWGIKYCRLMPIVVGLAMATMKVTH